MIERKFTERKIRRLQPERKDVYLVVQKRKNTGASRKIEQAVDKFGNFDIRSYD